MKRPLLFYFPLPFLLMAVSNGYGQPALVAVLRTPAKNYVLAPGEPRTVTAANAGKKLPLKKHSEPLSKYEQTCALRFFEFCDYLLAPPDIVIDSTSYSAGAKKEEVVMERERAEDTARIKKAVLRYTVMPSPTDTTDSLHFSQDELSDQDYRRLETAFSTIEKLLDTCYNSGGTPLKLVPLRLHDDATIRSQLAAGQFSSTFLLRRGKQTLAVLLFTPQNKMTAARPPRICGWAVDLRHGRMIFHHIAGDQAAMALSR